MCYNIDMNDNVCLECNQTFESSEFIRRHVKCHGVTFEQYVLKHVHAGIRPKCGCGCGGEPAWNVALKRYATFVHGHHAVGHVVSLETRAKIGAANSTKMREYMTQHPDVAKKRSDLMCAAITSTSIQRRSKTLRATYAAMTQHEKQKISQRWKRMWADEDKMRRARARGAATFKRRAASGEIDLTQRNDRLSARISQMYVDGSFRWCRGHHESSKTGLKHRYRSRWELQYMQLLDADPDVIQWRSEPTVVPYELNGHHRRYVPDFIVQRADGIELVEVKPMSLRDTAMNVAKRAAASAMCAREGWRYSEWTPS